MAVGVLPTPVEDHYDSTWAEMAIKSSDDDVERPSLFDGVLREHLVNCGLWRRLCTEEIHFSTVWNVISQ
jgi:hypothetical protein